MSQWQVSSWNLSQIPGISLGDHLHLFQFFTFKIGLNISLSDMICLFLIYKFFQAVTVSGCASLSLKKTYIPDVSPDGLAAQLDYF